MSCSTHGSLDELQDRLGCRFEDLGFLETALTHKSYANEHPHENRPCNERLEFLGDAVLDLAVGHLLMSSYPDETEGMLSRWRANLVNEKNLAEKARSLDLGRFLRLGKGEERTLGREKSSLLANTFEAVIGAIYLDRGYDPVFAVVATQFNRELVEMLEGIPAEEDFKTRLQEHTQSILKVTPRYTLKGEEGPDHDKLFHVELDLGGGSKALGHGKSKKEAEQRAAREMLERLRSMLFSDR
jgi:ribonuclease III